QNAEPVYFIGRHGLVSSQCGGDGATIRRCGGRSSRVSLKRTVGVTTLIGSGAADGYIRRGNDFRQRAGKGRAKRRGDPPAQLPNGGQKWVHIGNPGLPCRNP